MTSRKYSTAPRANDQRGEMPPNTGTPDKRPVSTPETGFVVEPDHETEDSFLHEGFETEEFAHQQDATRANRAEWSLPLKGGMRWTNMGPKLKLIAQTLHHIPQPNLDVERLPRLIALLRAQATGGSNSLASFGSMRLLRKALISNIHLAFEQFEDQHLRTATVICSRWRFSASELGNVDARKIKAQFRADLNQIGLTKMPGPFLAVLHGEFDPVSGFYQLHYHMLTTRLKAERLRKLRYRPPSRQFKSYIPTASGASPVRVDPVRDRKAQISYIAKPFWPSRGIRKVKGKQRRDRVPQRIREPYGTQVLLWLDKHRFLDLVVMHDLWSMRRGGTAAMRRLYLSITDPW